MKVDQWRFGLPFVGGITAIVNGNELQQAKEKTMKELTLKVNKIKEMCHDKKFQNEVLKALGITLATAIVVIGLVNVYKWWVAYKVMGAAGLVLTAKLWFKITGIAIVGGVLVYQGKRVYDTIDITDEIEKAIS